MFDKVKASYKGKGRRQDNVQKQKNAEFSIPLVCAKRDDNGIMYYGRPTEFTSHGHVLSVIYNGAVAAGLVYAQKEPVGVFTDSYLIDFKDGQERNFNVYLYMKTCIETVVYPKFSRERKATWDRIKNEHVFLPTTKDGNIDFQYMETYIRALMKISAKKIQQWLVTY